MKRIAVALFALALSACSTASSTQPDNLSAMQDIQTRRSGQEVTVQGTVASAPTTSRGPTGNHERFMIEVASGNGDQQLVLVAHNIDIAPRVPLQQGDEVIVHGQLDIDPSGPIIHYTHHDPRGRHVPGFIKVHGQTYD